MKVRVSIILAILSLQLFVFAQTKSEYVGFKYKGVVPGNTLPNGVKLLGGALVGDINAATVYGVSETQKGKVKMLWLEESTGKDSGGVTGWKVLDVLTFSTMGRTRYIFFPGDPAIGCRKKGVADPLPDIVGEGRIVRARNAFMPSNLWSVNLDSKKFEPMSLTGVTCEYDEF